MGQVALFEFWRLVDEPQKRVANRSESVVS